MTFTKERLQEAASIIVSDIDNNSEDLTLSIISAPNWLGIDEFDLIGTPSFNDGGDNPILLNLSDLETSSSFEYQLTIEESNQPPISSNIDLVLDEDSSIEFTLLSIDSEGDNLTYSYTSPSSGSITGNAPYLIYTPDSNFNGEDSFTYTASDSYNESSATININVISVNDIPVAESATFNMDSDESLVFNLSDYISAINEMKVRGAPLIGVTAAFGLAESIKKDPNNKNIESSYKKLLETRPTAVNLKWALDKIKTEVLQYNIQKRANIAFNIAKNIRKNDIEYCKRIGEHGYQIIKNLYNKKKRTINILTHCNAGWLAAIDWGTAIAPIYMSFKKKIPIHIWVDETRPRNQGALLTAWELEQEKIPYTVIVDNAGGYLMQKGDVDLCIVGSDRTAMNGDVCNKIGTYLKAISAYENKIPFFVALPISTFDKNSRSGNDIPIENRSSKEITHIKYLKNNKFLESKIFLNSQKFSNPAFDITPSKYITKLITNRGIINPNTQSIKKVMKS